MPVIRRRQISIALAALVAVVNLAFFTMAQLERFTVGDLDRRLVTIRTEVVDPSTSRSPVELRRELAAVEMQLNAAALAFPGDVVPLALQDHAIQAAALSSVTITSIGLQSGDSRSLAGVSYPVKGLTIQAEGGLADLHRFVNHMERSIYDTMFLEKVRLARGDRGRWTIQFDTIVVCCRQAAA